MKILVFTDVPPTHALTAGLVLDRLARFLPPGSMVCFAAMNRHIEAPRPAGLSWLPVHYTDKPDEMASQRFAGTPWLNNLWAAAVEAKKRAVEGRRILKKAVRFGREHKVDAVLVVLQGQTIINLAEPLADALGVPLYTLVWDPFSWWVRGHRMDPFTARRTQAKFDAAVKRSVACATASWAMSEIYQAKYGTRSVQVIASHDASLAKTPPAQLHDPHKVTIGMAGQFYASYEWAQMMTGLEASGWRIAGKPVHIKTMGGGPPPPSSIPPKQIEYLGWKSQPDMVAALSQCDILYCPYPFDPELKEVSQVSFPSKLVAYFAAGRPAVFQGPLDSSPGRYLVDREAAICVGTPYASSAYNALRALVVRPDLFQTVAENGQRAFREDFTLERMRETFYEFLGLTDDGAAFDASSAPFVEVVNDRADPADRVTWRDRAWSLISWIPPIPALVRRIRALEDEVDALSFDNAVQAAELTGLYGFTARSHGELKEAEATVEIAAAELQKKMAVQKPVFAKLG